MRYIPAIAGTASLSDKHLTPGDRNLDPIVEDPADLGGEGFQTTCRCRISIATNEYNKIVTNGKY
jgi:hypothetical protein